MNIDVLYNTTFACLKQTSQIDALLHYAAHLSASRSTFPLFVNIPGIHIVHMYTRIHLDSGYYVHVMQMQEDQANSCMDGLFRKFLPRSYVDSSPSLRQTETLITGRFFAKLRNFLILKICDARRICHDAAAAAGLDTPTSEKSCAACLPGPETDLTVTAASSQTDRQDGSLGKSKI